MHTLTPPYHFSIVACPPYLPFGDVDKPSEILYRGSIPAVRNFPFLKRLRLRSLICLQKKPLGEGDALVRWAAKHKVEILWIRAEKMTEESLGMGRTQVGDVLKTILDPSSYPLYLADKDGISHTTLLVSCLRKLQGWTPESILDEITRFEPDHEDLPLVPFITSYLSTGPPTDSLVLPSLPLPTWLWPTIVPNPAGQSEKSANSPASASATGMPHSRSGTGLSSQAREREPSAPKEREKDRREDREREKERERNASAPASIGPLPFPHPLSTRKHPTMKLTFSTPSPSASMPPPPIPASISSQRSSATGSEATTASPTTFTAPGSVPALSRVNSRRERSTTSTTAREDDQSLMAAATSILAASLVAVGVAGDEKSDKTVDADGDGRRRVVGDIDRLGEGSTTGRLSRTVSRHVASASVSVTERGESGQAQGPLASGLRSRSDVAGVVADQQLDGGKCAESDGEDGGEASSAEQQGESDEATELSQQDTEDDYEDEEDEEEDEDDEDEDDDDDVDLQPTSLHISALDLAGYS